MECSLNKLNGYSFESCLKNNCLFVKCGSLLSCLCKENLYYSKLESYQVIKNVPDTGLCHPSYFINMLIGNQIYFYVKEIKSNHIIKNKNGQPGINSPVKIKLLE
jgi:hypothetical protein